MQQYWLQWIPCRVVQCISIEWSGFHAAWCNWLRLNAVDSMQCDWMHWSPCSSVKCIPSECRGLHAAWLNGSWLNAVDSMQCSPMDPDWMQWLPCSMAQWILIECSGFHAAWPNWSWLMHWITCGMIECTGFHAALWNTSRVNAVDCMQRGAMYPGCMQWNPCSMLQQIPIECSGFPAELCNWYQLSSGFHASRFNAVDSMQRCEMDPEWMQWIPCSVAQWIPIECSGFHAAWLNAVDSNQSGAMYLHWMKRIPCSLV